MAHGPMGYTYSYGTVISMPAGAGGRARGGWYATPTVEGACALTTVAQAGEWGMGGPALRTRSEPPIGCVCVYRVLDSWYDAPRTVWKTCDRHPRPQGVSCEAASVV